VTPSELQAVARRYFQEDNRTLAVLAPETEPAPSATAALQDRPADVTSRKTAGGITLILREDHRLPFVYVCASFLGGVISETEETSGITQLMSDLLIRGTASRSAKDIAQTVESLGADLSTFSGYNSFGVQGRCLARDLDTLAEVISDCLAHATFPPEEIAKQKTVQLASIDAQREQPFFIAQQALGNILFAGHPYRWNSLGMRASVETMNHAILEQYCRQYVVSGNMALSIFGDIDPARAEAMAARFERAIRHAAAPVRSPVQAKPALPARVENKKQNEQCILVLGFSGVSIHDPRRDALQVLETAMSGMSSRLFHTIREERGLAYFAGASQRIGVDPGQFILYAGTRLEARAEVEALILQEVERVTHQGLEADEIARAKTQLIADAEMRLQDNMNLATACSLNELYGLGCGHDFTTRQRIEAVTAEQIRQAARSILMTNAMAVSVVIPEKPQPQRHDD
jgi:zinc protease